MCSNLFFVLLIIMKCLKVLKNENELAAKVPFQIINTKNIYFLSFYVFFLLLTLLKLPKCMKLNLTMTINLDFYFLSIVCFYCILEPSNKKILQLAHNTFYLKSPFPIHFLWRYKYSTLLLDESNLVTMF